MTHPYSINFGKSCKDAEAADDPLPKESDFDLEYVDMFRKAKHFIGCWRACTEKLLPARMILYANFLLYPGKVEDSAQTYNVCADCGKSYTKKAPLMKHVSKHVQIRCGNSLKCSVDSRRFCCDNCRYVYIRKESLMHHVKSHFGLKYHCDLCRKEFIKQLRGLKRHKRNLFMGQTVHWHNCLMEEQSTFCPHCPKETNSLIWNL